MVVEGDDSEYEEYPAVFHAESCPFLSYPTNAARVDHYFSHNKFTLTWKRIKNWALLKMNKKRLEMAKCYLDNMTKRWSNIFWSKTHFLTDFASSLCVSHSQAKRIRYIWWSDQMLDNRGEHCIRDMLKASQFVNWAF